MSHDCTLVEIARLFGISFCLDRVLQRIAADYADEQCHDSQIGIQLRGNQLLIDRACLYGGVMIDGYALLIGHSITNPNNGDGAGDDDGRGSHFSASGFGCGYATGCGFNHEIGILGDPNYRGGVGGDLTDFRCGAGSSAGGSAGEDIYFQSTMAYLIQNKKKTTGGSDA